MVNSVLSTDQRVPHISLVFREMWETRISLGSLWRSKNCKLGAAVSHISRKTSEIWGTLWSVLRTDPKRLLNAVPRRPGGTLRVMVKGITMVRPAGSPEAYTRLASFFSALGFEGGRGWEEKLSRGVSFLAPLGNLEFADGIAPSAAEIMVEVSGLDSVQAVAHDWMVRTWGEHEAARRLTAVTETGWKTRLFTAEPAPGHSIAFWEWDDPHKGKPLAVEGDLNAHGMRFAVVVARWNAV